jgi:multiple sugar transport system ATP-binding protein
VNLFVAGFIGSPAMNFVTARLARDNGPAVTFGSYKLPVPDAVMTERAGLDDYIGKDVILGIRPSDFEDATLAEAGWSKMPVTAGVTEDLGSEIHVLFTIDCPQVEHASISQAVAGEEGDDASLPLDGDKAKWTARVASRSPVKPGRAIELAVDTSKLQFFDPQSGLSIGHH